MVNEPKVTLVMMDLDELERLLEDSTPGEWVARSNGMGVVEYPYDGASEPLFYLAADRDGFSTTINFIARIGRGEGCAIRKHDAALIAAARNALPELLRVARAVKAWGEARRSAGLDGPQTDPDEWSVGSLYRADAETTNAVAALADSLALSASLAKEG